MGKRRSKSGKKSKKSMRRKKRVWIAPGTFTLKKKKTRGPGQQECGREKVVRDRVGVVSGRWTRSSPLETERRGMETGDRNSRPGRGHAVKEKAQKKVQLPLRCSQY